MAIPRWPELFVTSQLIQSAERTPGGRISHLLNDRTQKKTGTQSKRGSLAKASSSVNLN
ncbi:hypothetical protein RBWH47_01650 [Rhodopirellula baltica WH47]|uniref:Uncharacterized protein n=1 Tax=Rhodopirellula baltica WH47 TaxID=991778 RepID=F2ALD9_RHOBT|nr:hypothetical protein RBWH47_01650 [Rhodopirellula baltica WH47]